MHYTEAHLGHGLSPDLTPYSHEGTENDLGLRTTERSGLQCLSSLALWPSGTSGWE
jgi:hypothetical protein